MKSLTTTDLTVIDGEHRVLDTRLGERLGYERPRVIREMIERNRDELRSYGPLSAVPCGAYRGQPTTEYHLNEGQALLLCMFSKTESAALVRKEVISTFLAVRHGALAPQFQPKPYLTLEMIQEIRDLYACGAFRQIDLAHRFGLSQVDVSVLTRGVPKMQRVVGTPLLPMLDA